MSRWSTCRPDDRGQTDPIPALLAITVLAIGFTIYASYVVDLKPGTSDRELAEPTLDNVWDEIQTNGVYDDANQDLESAVAGSPRLPEGRYVYVAITIRDEGSGQTRTVGEEVFGPSGSTRDDVLADVRDDGLPEDATTASRSVPVRVAPGKVRAAQLDVVVWGN